MSRLPDKEVMGKPIRPKGLTCVNVQVYGHRDPRGPDNNVRVWVDKDDKLHIRVEKTQRCYHFETMVNVDGYVEIIAN